jgi:hypothetical protein
MELNKMELMELMELLKTGYILKLSEELVDQIADDYGVLIEDQSQVEWLQFIITNYA